MILVQPQLMLPTSNSTQSALLDRVEMDPVEKPAQPRVFLGISIGGRPIGRAIFELVCFFYELCGLTHLSDISILVQRRYASCNNILFFHQWILSKFNVY